MPDVGWTFSVDETTASVRLTTPVDRKRAEALGVHPIIGRSDPRVLPSGNFSTDISYGVVALTEEDDGYMQTVCDSGAVVTVTSPASEFEYVRVKTWTRIARRPNLVIYTLETIRAI